MKDNEKKVDSRSELTPYLSIEDLCMKYAAYSDSGMFDMIKTNGECILCGGYTETVAIDGDCTLESFDNEDT